MVGSLSEHLEAGEGVRGFSRGILLTQGTTYANVTVVLTDRRLLLIESGEDGGPVIHAYPRELCRIVKSRQRDDGSYLVGIQCFDQTIGLCFQKAWESDALPLLENLQQSQVGGQVVPIRNSGATG